MSKTTQPSGQFSISGGPTSRYSKGTTSYYLTPTQEQAYKYAQKSFAEGLEGINAFSPETLASLNEEVNAYKNNALKILEDTYQPLIHSTMEDAAKRFGNLDNSVYLQNLNSLENKRADAAKALAQDVASKQSELKSTELQNRYNYLNFLNNFQNSLFNNALNASGMANSSAKISSSQSGQNPFADIATMMQLAGTVASFI